MSTDLGRNRRRRSARSVPALLLLAAVTVLTVDAQGGQGSPFDPVRRVVGDAVAPAQEGVAVVARPLSEIPAFFVSHNQLRADVRALQAENANLRGQLAGTSEVRHRVAELDGLLRSSRSTGLALVPARVVGIGPAQSFSRTVTIDAGTSSGVKADMTVLNHDGLVGRVISATRGSATVLLLADRHSVVGARLGSNAEVGLLRGRGDVGGKSRLDLALVDDTETPAEGDVILTWGSRNGSPYVPGVPIGTVASVFSSPRDQAKHAVIRPFVDFSSLDLVGVVVKSGTASDRTVIEAGEVPAPGED